MAEENNPLTSPKGSMNGYSFKTWFFRNKDTWKNLLMVGSSIATYFITSGNVPQWLNLTLTGVVPILVKLGSDAIDFYSTNVDLS